MEIYILNVNYEQQSSLALTSKFRPLKIELPLDLALSPGLLYFIMFFLKVSFGIFLSVAGMDCFEYEVDFPYPELLTTP